MHVDKRNSIAIILCLVVVVISISLFSIGISSNISGKATSIINSESTPYEELSVELSPDTNLGSVLSELTEEHFTALEKKLLITSTGNEKYCQSIRFIDSSGALQPPRLQIYETGYALRFIDYNSFFEYELGVCNKFSGIPQNLINVPLNILGRNAAITDYEIKGNNNERLTLNIITDPLVSEIYAGSAKKYTILNNDLTINNIGLSVKEDGKRYAKFNIDGEIVELSEGDYAILESGIMIGISDILLKIAYDAEDKVKFYLGSNRILLIDNNYKDTFYYKSGAYILDDNIEDASVRIEATYENDILKIKSINYRLRADKGALQDIYLIEGESLTEYLIEPEGMLGNWDITYEGFDINTEKGTIKISFGQPTQQLTSETKNENILETNTTTQSVEQSYSSEPSIEPTVSIEGSIEDQGETTTTNNYTKWLITAAIGIAIIIFILIYILIYFRNHKKNLKDLDKIKFDEI